MSVYYGTKPIEFEKGKAGIAVASKDKLPALIDALIGAAKAGELDGRRPDPRTPKRAAHRSPVPFPVGAP